MTDQRMPDRDQASEKAGPDEKERQDERASTPDQNNSVFDEHEAARRQARQDPLQKRDR